MTVRISKKYALFLLVCVLAGSIFLLPKNENINQTPESGKQLKRERVITHGHGLAVDVSDSTKLYIATHHGLLLLKNEKELYRIGESQDDYMGFSVHPKKPNIFFSSGHPVSGGNMGFQTSQDGGWTWKNVSPGVNGPVDFHALAVSPANQDLLFGWYQGALQRSTNGGKSWEIIKNTDFVVVGLTADPKDENNLYAASPQGLFLSTNKGEDWIQLLKGFVSVVAIIDSKDSQQVISYSQEHHLATSRDGGKTWQPIDADFKGEVPLYIAVDRQKGDTAYLLTEKNSIYKSENKGRTWKQVY